MLAMTEIQQEFPSCFLTVILKKKTHSRAFGPVRERHLRLGRWGILASLAVARAMRIQGCGNVGGAGFGPADGR
jgi:hypothetical protein